MTEIRYPVIVGSALGGGEERKRFRLTSAGTIYYYMRFLVWGWFLQKFWQIFSKINKTPSRNLSTWNRRP